LWMFTFQFYDEKCLLVDEIGKIGVTMLVFDRLQRPFSFSPRGKNVSKKRL
jgi:hypothetical protein